MTAKKDSSYTGGVIAVREKKLLREKIVRMCGMSADEAFRVLLDSGFGGGEAASVDEVESMVLADEREIDAFIREYSPSQEELVYLLSPRDFHNAKAIVKARHLHTDETPMLGSEGNIPVATLAEKIDAGEYESLGRELGGAVKEAKELLEQGAGGAEAGFVFDKALSEYFRRTLKKLSVAQKLHARYVDMTNLLTAFRALDEESAKKFYLAGGALSEEALKRAFGDVEQVEKAFAASPYAGYVKKLCAAKQNKTAFTQAEKELASFELNYFSEKPYELSGKGNFYYYVLRRRAENENVRIVFVCLNAGLKESEIIKRLRGI